MQKFLSNRDKKKANVFCVFWICLTEDEQVAWYRKWQEHGQGKKRTLDDWSWEEFGGKKAYIERHRHTYYIPFIIFRRHGLAEQKDDPTILREFEEIVADPNIHCKYDNDVGWLVPAFQGINEFQGEQQEAGQQVISIRKAPLVGLTQAFAEHGDQKSGNRPLLTDLNRCE